MRSLSLLGTAVMLCWAQSASGACINNHTGATLHVDQYSLVSEEDVFAVEPGQRVCREHTGLFHRYDVGLIPYDNTGNARIFYLVRDSDEFVVEGTCQPGASCKGQLTFARGDGTTAKAGVTEHASR